MRVIFNIHSNKAAKTAGWRAREVKVNDRNEADLEETLKAVTLKDGSSIYEYIIDKGRLGDDWTLFVNGIRMSGSSCLGTNVKDNVQIHLMYNPNT